ncbi:DUF433 domain-containing protein [Haloarchaeobius salinus]|uniref:DUF433 domain-containing protein n=1 Tax=Haloarchaeobius salinus TaxID=1198298 RepID=UPI00210AFE52|nr:DUF433 domain-containing protein [Haloarchaeobius salinus]
MGDEEYPIVFESVEEPHIEGRSITVRFIKERVEDCRIDPHEVAEEHDLDVGDVYLSMAFYHDNDDAMRELEERKGGRIEQNARRAVNASSRGTP